MYATLRSIEQIKIAMINMSSLGFKAFLFSMTSSRVRACVCGGGEVPSSVVCCSLD